jgi:mevalonate kinase
LADTLEVFSPGEVIFFGEHSVVYGMTAYAAAIDCGVTVLGEAAVGKIELRTQLGCLRADLDGLKLRDVDAAGPLEPLLPLFERVFRRVGKGSGIKAILRSDIPVQAGLASSAAVSSALIEFLLGILGERLPAAEQTELVYQSEIDIQGRGSIIGSATTVNGGVIRVSGGRWEPVPVDCTDLPVVVIDSGERCATSITTRIVAERLSEDEMGVRRLFAEMDEVADAGFAALKDGRISDAGRFMTDNQSYLARLGVSTPKIDALLERLAPLVWGAKITGAGGGGCVVCLPKADIGLIQTQAQASDCRLIRARLSPLGVSRRLIRKGAACAR